MTEESKGQKAADISARTASAGAAVVIGSLVAGPVGGLAGVAVQAALDEVAPRLIGAIFRRREERAAQVIAVGAASTGTGIDRFSETIENSPALLALLSETVQAAMDTPLEAKIYALGLCLAHGVEDDTRVDAERLRVRGLARIETQEAKLMAVLYQPLPPAPSGTEPRRGWNRADIVEDLPGYADVLDASMALLVAEGLAAENGAAYGGGGPGQENWILTNFGRDVLQLLQAVTPSDIPRTDQQT
ncbi:hypothetical protein [Streptomyces sp. NBC_00827]|uniref:hypothetical protein n=1 Tax=Streptomyces sp. NBC_00827 TaxID=2903677 RepID=UPI003869BE58|nr:hypothetical protein OG569_02230 [Streptomyces sp. NBC_00827]